MGKTKGYVAHNCLVYSIFKWADACLTFYVNEWGIYSYTMIQNSFTVGD